MSSPVRVLVVDDQQIVREGLATVLDLLADVSVVGTAGDTTGGRPDTPSDTVAGRMEPGLGASWT